MVDLVQCPSDGECAQPQTCGFRHNGAPDFACFVCHKICGNGPNLSSHRTGKKHLRLSNITLPSASSTAPPIPASRPPHDSAASPLLAPAAPRAPSDYCHTCDRRFNSPRQMKAHRASRAHARRTRLSTNAATAFAESSKHGVSVLATSGIVFKTVEYSTLKVDPIREAYYKIKNDGREPVFLVGVVLRSATNFSFQPHSIPRPLVPGLSFDGVVSFNPVGALGHFNDVATFNFTTGTTEFTIRRTVSAHVIVQEDADRHAPNPVYKPPPKTLRARRAHGAVRGPAGSRRPTIVGALKFATFNVPSVVREASGCHLAVEDRVRNARSSGLIPLTLDLATHTQTFRSLLWMEELQETDDISRYDLNDAPLTRRGDKYSLTVPGLAEKRPSVVLGDSIKIRASGDVNARFYDGRVVVIEQSSVGMQFNHSFRPLPTATFHVQFSLSRSVMKIMHHVLDAVAQQPRLLFPEMNRYPAPAPPFCPSVHPGYHNLNIGRNERQKLAIASIYHKKHGASPFLLFGPPGTGKTSTLVEAIIQIVEDQDGRVLVCAPSNAAADTIAERLVEHLGPGDLFRLYANGRPRIAVPDWLKPYTHYVSDSYSVPALEELLDFRVVVATCIASATLIRVQVPRTHFTHIFVDECGQTIEPCSLVPLALASDLTSVILAGDPKQLGPIVLSRAAEALGLDKSLLERLMLRPLYDPADPDCASKTVVKLVNNYRSHPAILEYPNLRFYDGELVPVAAAATTGALADWIGWGDHSDFPIIFHAVNGGEMREGSSPSFYNGLELTQVKLYVERLLREAGVEPKNIGVISPYNAQVKKLRKELQEPDIDVGSVEQFQGQERQVIVVSTRFNVTVTRAQAALIIVGDPCVLELDEGWAGFLCYIHRHGGWRGQPWDASRWDRNPSYNAAQDRRREAEDDLAEQLARMGLESLDGSSTSGSSHA